MRTKLTRENIKPEEYYSPSEVMSNDLFPWIKSAMTFIAILNSDKGVDLFKPIVKATGKTKRYHIKGENILKVMELADEGKLTL